MLVQDILVIKTKNGKEIWVMRLQLLVMGEGRGAIRVLKTLFQ